MLVTPLVCAKGSDDSDTESRPEGEVVSSLKLETKLGQRVVATRGHALRNKGNDNQVFPSLRLASGLPGVVASTPEKPTEKKTKPVTLAEPTPPLPFEAATPGPSVTKSAAHENAGFHLPDFTLIEGWAIPPVRWGGNASTNYNWNDNSSGAQSLTNTNMVNLRASSYIYQPWYAQVSGDLGLLFGNTSQSGSGASQNSSSTAINYGGNLNLFPQSRFPLQAYVQQSDSRAKANASSTDYSSTRLGIQQSYRPPIGQGSISGSYDRSVVETATLRSVVDAMQGRYGDNFDRHNISATGRYSQTTGDVGGQQSKLFNLTGNHSWRAEDNELTVSSSASFMDNQIRAFSGSGMVANDTQLIQADSSFNWIPDPELPVSVIGGGNFLNLNTATNSGGTSLTSLNGFANANYRISNNLQANGGISVFQILSDGINQFSSTQNASLSYSGNPLIFGEYSYNWGTGASVTNQIATVGEANRGVSGQAQHSLLRNIVLDDKNSITLNASQGVSLTNNSQSGQSGVLTNSGGAMWRLAIGARTVGFVSATASDTLSTGYLSSHYRSFSTQGSFQAQLTGRSAVSASANFVYSQQIKATQSNDPNGIASNNLNGDSALNGSGQILYTHRSPFNVSNLFYSASLQINSSKSNQRVLSGNTDANLWQTGTVFQQNLDYRIGRLIFRATSSFAELNGKKNASIYFSANREFGDF